MRASRSLITAGFSLGIGLVALVPMGGCGDDSKTTGTQFQLSPQAKADLEDMRAAQAEQRAERQRERAARRGR
jgi:hypothetical protein